MVLANQPDNDIPRMGGRNRSLGFDLIAISLESG
jgi:hypothetical protein